MIRDAENPMLRLRTAAFLAAAAGAVLVALPAAGGEAGRSATAMEPPQAALLRNIAFTQRLDNLVPLQSQLTDDHGRRVTLGECMNGRPTVFVLAYYRCPMLCNQVLNGMARAVQALDFKPGVDFEIVVVSFDPTDTWELAADKKQSVVHVFSRDGDPAGWHFLVGQERTVRALADSVGFQYQYDPATQQYAHASGIVVLTPAGRVSKYFYGIDYPTRDLRLGLVEASAGRIGTAVDELLLYCFHYDPLTGRYGLAIIRIIRAAGALTVASIIGYIGVSVRRERKAARQAVAFPGDADATGRAVKWA
ncbi:MAG: SCO family protein [Planctomycetota bacterium]|nr:MAG: SCO family protein [Planctomycetota bacterium]